MCETKNRIFLAGENAAIRTLYWSRPDCHLWSCADCAEINKKRWTAIVAHGIEVYQDQGVTDWRFVTITSHEKLKTFNQTLYVWREAWPKLSTRMRREFKGLKYVFLPEKHISGRLHMHALASGGMSTRWLKDNARECGFGYKNESDEPLSIALSAFYCLKYITKSLTERSYWPKSLHRVRTSQKWPKTPIEPYGKDLGVSMQPIGSGKWTDYYYNLKQAGWKIINIETGESEGVQF